MTDHPDAPVISPAEAAGLLLWLRDMGADEVLSDRPLDRFAEKPPAPAPRAVSERPRPTPPPVAAPAPVAPNVSIGVSIGANVEALHAAARKAQSLAELSSLLEQFDAHPLKRSASKLCFVGGAAQARVLVLVDRPRNEEDRSGKVLADRHELLAERMLAAIGLCNAEDGTHEQVALLSFLPWRPPGNRPPNELECRMVLPFAERAVQLLQPRLVLAFGALPGQWLAGGTESIQRQRGKWLSVNGIPMMSTFHPETLLKSPASKRLAWHDLLALREKLEGLA